MRTSARGRWGWSNADICGQRRGRKRGLCGRPICTTPNGYQMRTAIRATLGQRQIRQIVIVISRFLKCYLKAKSTRAPAYSRALRRIKGGFQRGSREAQVGFPEYQEGTE